MAESFASFKTASTSASPSGAILVGSTLTLDDHSRVVQRPHQTPSIFTTNPNPTRIPCLQPLQLLGLSLQTACKLIAAILTVDGIALAVMGAILLALQQRDKTDLLSKQFKRITNEQLLQPLKAQLFIGAVSTTRGILYTFLSIFLGIAASRANLCACRCWVLIHGILLAFSGVAAVVGIALYAPTWRLILALLLPMVPCLLEIYGLYVAWAFTKELDAAAFAHRKIQNDAHGRFPVPSGSETKEILPLGLEMNASSHSYQLKLGDNRKGGRPGESPDGTSGGSAAAGKTAGESPESKKEGAGASGSAAGKTVGGGPVDKVWEPPGGGAGGANKGTSGGGQGAKVWEPPGGGGETLGGASSSSDEDEETAAAREQRKKKLKSAGRSLRRSRSRIN